jgi:hypothetical protein
MLNDLEISLFDETPEISEFEDVSRLQFLCLSIRAFGINLIHGVVLRILYI